MDIARTKREENIAEYVLYIWQLEDLVRALQFNTGTIYSALVSPRNASDEWKTAAMEWYAELAGSLQKEGKAEGGHLDHTLHIIAELDGLHMTLMQQPAGARYRELFGQLAPSLPSLRTTLGDDGASDMELAFRALYAAMLYRIKGIKGDVADEVVALVSPVIALLSDIYHKAERGEIDLYKS